MRPIVLGSLMVLMFAACGGTASPTGAGAASGVRATLGSPAPAGQAGAISGHLGYPSEFLPGLGVYAISVDGARYYKVESASYQPQYTMVGVPAGDYYVYAASRWPIGFPQERFGAAYTTAVPCGVKVGCDDHSPITVHVTAGSTTPDV